MNKHNIENSGYTLIQATILTLPEWTDKKKSHKPQSQWPNLELGLEFRGNLDHKLAGLTT